MDDFLRAAVGDEPSRQAEHSVNLNVLGDGW